MTDVLVVGAGAAGLVAANLLARQGRSVRLLDKQQRMAPALRGELVQPGSLAVLERAGALDGLRRAGALPLARLVCRHADGAEIGSLDYRLLPGGGARGLLHDHPAIQQALHDALPPSVEVDRGAAVVGLVESGDRVVGVRVRRDGREDVEPARLVVGADGLASAVRRAGGLDVVREPYDHDLLALDLDVVVPTLHGDDGVEAGAHLTSSGLRLLLPLPGGRTRLYAQVPTGLRRTLGRDGHEAWAHELLADTPALVTAGADVADAVVAAAGRARSLPAHRFVATRWQRPGLVLLGDAAHGVHPMAGQGMNAAFRDAEVLADALDGAEAGPAGVGLDRAVAAYEAVRRPQVAYVARLSHNLARLFTDQSWTARVLARRMLERNRDNARLCSILTYNVSGLGVRRYDRRDRLVQLGLLPDPGRHVPEPSLVAPGGRG